MINYALNLAALRPLREPVLRVVRRKLFLAREKLVEALVPSAYGFERALAISARQLATSALRAL